MPIFKNHLDFKNYEKNFLQVKSAIAKGRSYQVNLTQSFHLIACLMDFLCLIFYPKDKILNLKRILKMKDAKFFPFLLNYFLKSIKEK